jgi:hypothetical protein
VLRFGALAVDAWHGITARQLWTVALLTLAYAGVLTLGALPMLLERRVWTPLVNAILSALLSGFAVLFAIALVERAIDARRLRSWHYALAVMAGVAVAALWLWVVSQRLIGITTGYVDAGTTEPFGNFVLRHWLHASLVCGLGTAVYVARKRGAERLATLHALQIQAAESEKLLLTTRLTAVQARVEPRFLLDTLARVELLYERDIKAGDRLLGQLVTYLRAALPHLRDIASTLGREMKLAEAYLAVHEGTGNSRLRMSFGGAATEHTSVPPMLLLPSIDHALTVHADRDHVCRDFAIEAIFERGRLRITLRDARDGFAPETAVSESIVLLRERLQALYADAASLVLRRTEAGTAAVFDIPEPTG